MKILLLLPLLLCLSGCTFSNDTYYQQAQLYLGSGDYASAASLFSQLGEYEDSADYTLYCAALEALDAGQLTVAKADMALIAPFKSSERYLQYIAALELESTGKLEEALAAYEALGSFVDSLDRAERMREAIPQRDLAHARALMGASRWEQALTILETLDGYGESNQLLDQCRREMDLAAYDQALRLYNSEQYEEALTAFESLGELLDASVRARMCRGAMYRQLEEDYANASMATARELMDRYAEMEGYLASAQRLQDLQERFAVNLQLAEATLPYAAFGEGLLWRVMQVQDGQALLLAQSGSVFATATDLAQPFTPAQESAIVAFEYPRLTIDLNRYAFTQGSGTQEEPYQ